MVITLPPEQLAWIDARIGSDEFASADEAVRRLIGERIAEHEAENEDEFAWAKSYVDAAEAEIDAGQFRTFEEHQARMDALIRTLKDRWLFWPSPLLPLPIRQGLLSNCTPRPPRHGS